MHKSFPNAIKSIISMSLSAYISYFEMANCYLFSQKPLLLISLIADWRNRIKMQWYKMREFRLINKIADLVAQTVNKTTNFIPLLLNDFLNHYEGKEFESATKLLSHLLLAFNYYCLLDDRNECQISVWSSLHLNLTHSWIEGSGNRTCERKN